MSIHAWFGENQVNHQDGQPILQVWIDYVTAIIIHATGEHDMARTKFGYDCRDRSTTVDTYRHASDRCFAVSTQQHKTRLNGVRKRSCNVFHWIDL